MADDPTTPTAQTTPTSDGNLGERVGKLEQGQERQDGKLDQILGMLTGAKDKPADPVTTADPAPAAADMAEQMRQAVRDVNAEAAAATPAPSRPDPETSPRKTRPPLPPRSVRNPPA